MRFLSRDNSQFVLIACLLLFALSLGVFWQTVSFDFTNYDDDRYVRDNPHVIAGMTGESVKWAFTSNYEATWQPMVWLSYLLDRQVYGLRPFGFHLTNVLLHAANAILLFLLLFRMTRRKWESAVVAAIFAVHPLRVESVAWIAERKDVLSGLFWLLALLAYVVYVERPNWKRYALVCLAFALGLMSKPMVVTLPGALLLLDYWPLRRVGAGWRKLLLEKVPMLALAVVSSLIAVVVMRQSGVVSSFGEVSIGERLSNAAVFYISYLGKMIWPVKLAAMYPHPGNTLPIWQVAASVAVLGLVSLFVFRSARHKQYLIVGWLWYLLTLLPVIGLIAVGTHGLADRFTYIPMMGLLAAVVWCVSEAVQTPSAGDEKAEEGAVSRQRGPVLVVASAVVVVLLAGRCYVQAGYWRDSKTLFQRTIEVTSRNYVAENQLGVALEAEGNLEEAFAHYQKSVEYNPSYVNGIANLAKAMLTTGRTDQAIVMFSRLVKALPRDARARLDLGMAYQKAGRLDEAIREMRTAVSLRPDYVPALGNLGNALASQGDTAGAAEQFARILDINPNDQAARHNLEVAREMMRHPLKPAGQSAGRATASAQAKNQEGLALAKSGDLDQAVARYREAIRLSPRFADAYCNLGMALAMQNRIDEAVSEYESALKIDANHFESHVNLAAALGGQGKLDEAIIHFRRAAQIKPERAEVHSNLALALFYTQDYAGAWKEVHLCEKYGGSPNAAFVQDLSTKMPDPGG